MSEEQESEISLLRQEVERWMTRSNGHAMEADVLRARVVNLKGRLWEMERDAKAKDIVLQCARQALNQADKLNAELAHRLEERNPCAT